MHGRAKVKVTADADTQRAKFSRAVRPRSQVIEHHTGGEFLRRLQCVTLVRLCLIVGKHGAGRHHNNVTMAGEKNGGVPYRRGDLEYL